MSIIVKPWNFVPTKFNYFTVFKFNPPDNNEGPDDDGGSEQQKPPEVFVVALPDTRLKPGAVVVVAAHTRSTLLTVLTA